MLDFDSLPPFLRAPGGRRVLPAGSLSRAGSPAFNVDVAAMRDIEAGGSVTSNALPGVRMLGQLADNWCWSAVTQAVIDFVVGTAPRQDEIATRHLKLDGNVVCKPVGETRQNGLSCGDGDSCRGHCDDLHRVRVVLAENNRFDVTLANDEAPTFVQIQSEIDAGRPVVCRVAWTLGGGHFILVTGWTIGGDGVARVHVLDPKRNEGGEVIPERIVAYDEFASRYSLMGATGAINFAYRIK